MAHTSEEWSSKLFDTKHATLAANNSWRHASSISVPVSTTLSRASDTIETANGSYLVPDSASDRWKFFGS